MQIENIISLETFHRREDRVLSMCLLRGVHRAHLDGGIDYACTRSGETGA